MQKNTDDRYNWAKASGIFKFKRNVTFDDIRKNSSFPTDIWKEQYQLANEILHPSSQGTFFRLGGLEKENSIAVGRTDYGLTLPGVHSAISLSQITTYLLSLYSVGNSLLNIKILEKWIDVIRESYSKTHAELFPDDKI